MVYNQQCLKSDHVVGFRNSADDPWILYETGRHGAVISMAPGAGGYSPSPEWTMTGLDGVMADLEAKEIRRFWEWLDSEINRLSPGFVGPHRQCYPVPTARPLGNLRIRP